MLKYKRVNKKLLCNDILDILSERQNLQEVANI